MQRVGAMRIPENPEGWSQDVLRGVQEPQQVWGPLGKLPFTTFGNELLNIEKEMRGATGIPIIDAIVPPSAITGHPIQNPKKVAKEFLTGDAFVRNHDMVRDMSAKELEAMFQSAATYHPNLSSHYIAGL